MEKKYLRLKIPLGINKTVLSLKGKKKYISRRLLLFFDDKKKMNCLKTLF